MAVWRVLGVLALSCGVLNAQGQDIYQRAKQVLGEDAGAELRAKNFGRLEERLARVIPAGGSERMEVLSLKGAVEFLDGKMAGAVNDFREAGKTGALREGDRFTLAMALVKLGDEAGARAVLSALSNEHQNTAIYWYWLGRLDYYQRRYGEAVEKLEKAVKLDPKAARGWDSLGLAWDMQGHLEQARAMFEKATALNREQPEPSPWPPHNLGYLLLRIGETAKAEEALRESLRYDGNLAQTHYYLGRSLEKDDQANAAIEEYRIAVAGDLTSADSCYSLAMLYQKLHREQEAKAMFAEFKRRKENSAPQAPPSH